MKYLDTRDNNIYEVMETTEDTVKLVSIDKKATKTIKKTSKLFAEAIIIEYKDEPKKARVNVARTQKANKADNAEKMEAFINNVAESLESPYSAKWEANKKKLIIVYNDEKSGKWRNILELFYKTRFDSVHCFIREENLMDSIEYDRELAESNKNRSYNFWIEKHIDAYSQNIQNVLDFVKTICDNHKNSLIATVEA